MNDQNKTAPVKNKADHDNFLAENILGILMIL